MKKSSIITIRPIALKKAKDTVFIKLELEPLASFSIVNGPITPNLQMSDVKMSALKLHGLIGNALRLHSPISKIECPTKNTKKHPLYKWLDEKKKVNKKIGGAVASVQHVPVLAECIKFFEPKEQARNLANNAMRFIDSYSHQENNKSKNYASIYNAASYYDHVVFCKFHQEVKEFPKEIGKAIKNNFNSKNSKLASMYSFPARKERIISKQTQEYYLEVERGLGDSIIQKINQEPGLYMGDKEGYCHATARVIEELPENIITLEIENQNQINSSVLEQYGQICANSHTGIEDDDFKSAMEYVKFLFDNCAIEKYGEFISLESKIRGKEVVERVVQKFVQKPRILDKETQILGYYSLIDHIVTDLKKFLDKNYKAEDRVSATNTLYLISKPHTFKSGTTTPGVHDITALEMARMLSALLTFTKPFWFAHPKRVAAFPVCNEIAMKAFVKQIEKDSLDSNQKLKDDLLQKTQDKPKSLKELKYPMTRGNYEHFLQEKFLKLHIPPFSSAQILYLLGYISSNINKNAQDNYMNKYIEEVGNQIHFYILDKSSQANVVSFGQHIVESLKSPDFDFVNMLESIRKAIGSHVWEWSKGSDGESNKSKKVVQNKKEMLWRSVFYFLQNNEPHSLQMILAMRQNHNEDFGKFITYYFKTIKKMDTKIMAGAQAAAKRLNTNIYVASLSFVKDKYGKSYDKKDLFEKHTKIGKDFAEKRQRFQDKLFYAIKNSRNVWELTSIYNRVFGGGRNSSNLRKMPIEFADFISGVSSGNVPLIDAKNMLNSYISIEWKSDKQTNKNEK